MKFKIPQPEDYPEMEFSKALTKSHAKIYVEMFSLLTTLGIALDAYEAGDMYAKDASIAILTNLLNGYKV